MMISAFLYSFFLNQRFKHETKNKVVFILLYSFKTHFKSFKYTFLLLILYLPNNNCVYLTKP